MLLKAAGFYARSATPAASTTARRGWQDPAPVELGGRRVMRAGRGGRIPDHVSRQIFAIRRRLSENLTPDWT
jgi:hypothetical protein